MDEREKENTDRLMRAFGLTLSDQGHLIVMVGEMIQGREKNGPYKSRHEALGVIYEEFIELRDEIFANEFKKAAAEAYQLAATALRFACEFGNFSEPEKERSVL